MNRASPRLTIAAAAAPEPHADGRRRRAADSRARIVQAMLEMVHAGDISPAAEEVAARAEVGLRTVFRHFRDMESLYREMAAVIEAELQSILDEPLRGRDWRARVREMLARRAAVYETIAPFKRAADVHRQGRPSSPPPMPGWCRARARSSGASCRPRSRATATGSRPSTSC